MIVDKKVDILICCQPYNLYYQWQVEVMLNNFYEVEIPFYHEIQIIWAINSKSSDHFKFMANVKKIENKFKLVKFFYYEDTRILPIKYVSSIRPHCLKKHWKEFPNLFEKVIFYHDCDIIFTKKPTFLYEDLNIDEHSWLVSNTVDYIGYNYLIDRDKEIVNYMFSIVGLHPQVAIDKQPQSGGCQYIMHSINWLFWHKVEIDCENLFYEVTHYIDEKNKENIIGKNEIQIWCADMWCILWNAWAIGFDTIIDKNLDFLWSKDEIKKWDSCYIYHNAGIVKDDKEKHFYKTDYQLKLPYQQDLTNKYNKIVCQTKYLELIDKVGETSVLLYN